MYHPDIQDSRNIMALAFVSICSSKHAGPIAVRKGVIKILVIWLRSGDEELARNAVSALRYLLVQHDEYVLGFIHSEVANEDALSAVVSLAQSASKYILHLSVAEILCSLSLAPHTRAAIVKANGVPYLVQLLVNWKQMDSKLAEVTLTALLQTAVGSLYLYNEGENIMISKESMVNIQEHLIG